MLETEKEKVNLIISHLTGGGAQRVVSTLSHSLAKSYEVHITLHDSSNINYPYSGTVINLNIPVGNKLFSKVVNFIKRIFALTTIKRRLNAKATISFLESSNLINILAGRNGKIIISVRNFKSKRPKNFAGKVFRVLMKLLYNKSDYIVAVSKGLKIDLVKNYSLHDDKIKVIYNPLDFNWINSCKDDQIEENEEDLYRNQTIITAGRLCRQKGQWHLIRAFKEVKTNLPEAKLLILGTGELDEFLKEMVSINGLDGEVIFLGFQNNPYKYLSKATVFAFSSLFEGFPNAMLEAMACGLPIISSDCHYGPREILAPTTDYELQAKDIEHSQFGVLTPVCNGITDSSSELSSEEVLLADAIIQMLNSDSMRSAYIAKSLARSKDFAVDHVAEQWSELIQN